MSIITKIERIERIHDLIEHKRTGAPDQFARKLGISKSMLYLILKELKDLGAPIVYSKYRSSFMYRYPVEFKFGFTSDQLTEEELRQTAAGMSYDIKFVPI